MISVIIPTRNRADLLRLALRSLAKQTLPPSEIIVIDNGSRDQTRDVVELPARTPEEISARVKHREISSPVSTMT
jgi:glycosyltransferase involved in cell wall biosynthesis